MRGILVALTLAILVGTIRERYRPRETVAFTKFEDFTDQVYHGSVWIGTSPTGQVEPYLPPSRLATGWCVAQKDGYSYIVVAGHTAHGRKKLIVGQWNGSGPWVYSDAEVIGAYGVQDVGLIRTRAKIPPLPLADIGDDDYKAGDEVLVVGSHPEAAPAFPSVGRITEVRPTMFVTNGWAWYGHSGGAVILRRTNRVIGIVVRATKEHANDASLSECTDYRSIRLLLNTFDVRP